jgi:D-alanine-D-alanine ligase
MSASRAGERLRVALVYGGRSAEREVSLMSARTVAAALDPDKYELVPISIDSEGRWSDGEICALGEAPKARSPSEALCDMRVCAPLSLPPAVALSLGSPLACLERKGADAVLGGVDVLFPLLHGPYGEDGSIQGLARLADLPCVGSSVLGSALCMDKQAAKRVLRDSGIPIAPFRSFRSPVEAREAWLEVEARLGRDLFVKPANLGSSVGVSRVASRSEYERAIALAFEYDLKVLVEKTIVGREIEVAVLGNRRLRASLPGEVVPKGSFYSYEAKYIDEEGAEILAPAPLGEAETAACRRLALEACEALCVSGMARVDMFLPDGGEPVANEVNTIPGFTSRSMYPLLWEASGFPCRVSWTSSSSWRSSSTRRLQPCDRARPRYINDQDQERNRGDG